MSIFERIATLTKAAIHEGLNKLEDPVLLTGQYLRNLEAEIAEAEQNERSLKAAENVLKRRKQDYQKLIDTSEAEALESMKQGNEDAARLAVTAKLRYLESLQECTAGLEETQSTLAVLAENIVNAKEEQRRLKEKRAELTARARAAAEKTAPSPGSCGVGRNHGGHVQHLNTGAVSRGFERMEEKIAEQESAAEMAGHNSRTPSHFTIPAVNPQLQNAVDVELERLRNQNSSNSK